MSHSQSLSELDCDRSILTLYCLLEENKSGDASLRWKRYLSLWAFLLLKQIIVLKLAEFDVVAIGFYAQRWSTPIKLSYIATSLTALRLKTRLKTQFVFRTRPRVRSWSSSCSYPDWPHSHSMSYIHSRQVHNLAKSINIETQLSLINGIRVNALHVFDNCIHSWVYWNKNLENLSRSSCSRRRSL